MNIIANLPSQAARIAQAQGWNDNSIANLLLDFIKTSRPDDWAASLTEFLEVQAVEENEDEDDGDDGEDDGEEGDETKA